MKKDCVYGLCIVKDNKVLFVNENNKLSFPVVSSTKYRYTDVLHNYGLKALETFKDLGVYTVGNDFQCEVVGMNAEIADEKQFDSLLHDSSMVFIDMNMVEDYLCTNITLDEHRNQIDQMIVSSINKFRGIEEKPKKMQLVVRGK